jgi:hypothetical protein
MNGRERLEAHERAAETRRAVPNGSRIVSRAHNWMQALPLAERRLVCVDCGHVRPMSDRDRVPCRRKAEHPASGYGGVVIDMSGRMIGRMNYAGPWRVFRFRAHGKRVAG